MTEGPLLEREDDLQAADAALADALGGTGRVLLIEGPPGIGKTSLLEEIAVRAGGRGFALHQARGDDLEASLPYGVVSQLFLPALRQLRPSARRSLLGGPAARAMRMLVDLAESSALAREQSAEAALAYSLQWLVQELAGTRPRLLCVDDAHWADEVSLRALALLARRLEGLPVLICVATRTGPPAGVADALERLRDLAGGGHITLQPLAEEAVAELVGRRLGSRPDPSLTRGLAAATGGNPFLLHELLVALGTRGWSGIDPDPARLAQVAPASIGRFVLRRLAAAGEDAQRLARAVSVLGEAELCDAAALADLDEASAATAAERLAAMDVLAPEARLRFVHPILREAVRADIPAAHRSRAHGRAARILDAGGAPPDHVAAHLLEALPRRDPRAAEILRAAGLRARDRGAPDTSVRLLGRALSEPPSPETRSAIARELGGVQAAMGRPEAVATLEQAIGWATTPAQRTEAVAALARASFMVLDTGRALDLMAELTRDATNVDPELLLRLEGELLGSARLHPHSRDRAVARLDQLRDRALPSRPATVAILANLTLSAVERNQPAGPVADLARRALTGNWLLDESNNQLAYVVNALTWVDLLEEAIAVLDQVLDRAIRTGALTLSTMAYTARSRAQLRRGAVADAEADARIAHSLAREHGWNQVLPYTASHLADALLQEGETAAAAEVLGEAESGGAALEVPDFLDSLGRLLLTRSQPGPALDRFLACGAQLTARGGVDAAGIVPWRSHGALALIALGDSRGAGELATQEHELALASAIPGSIGVARTALGLAEGGQAGVGWLTQAVEALDRSPRVLARVEALVELGAMTRRLGRPSAARPQLRLALDLARRHGATALGERARTELLAAGGRPRRDVLVGVDALSASERRVADLAASGLSNRQIAQGLYVSMRTVATHLTHVYQKLGVDRREEIASALRRSPG